MIDIRGEDVDSAQPAIDDCGGHSFGVALHVDQQRRHVLERIVGLQVGGLVGDQPVRGRVCAVEPVLGELRDPIEQRVGGGLRNPPLQCAADELRPLLGHLGLVLLAHRGTQDVGLAHRESGQLAGGHHHLFLVDHHPVRFAQDRLQALVHVLDRLAALFARDEGGDVDHRARPEQSNGSGYVLEALGPHVHQHPAHAGTFELEHAVRVAVGDQLIGLRVIGGQMLEVDLDSPPLLEQAHACRDDVQVLEAEEVDLQQADVTDRLHVVLGDHRLAAGTELQRRVANERFRGDHDAGGMGAHVARNALQRLGHVDQAPGLIARLVRLAKLGDFLDRILERLRAALPHRYELGQPVGVAKRNLEHTTDVPDRCLRGHRREGDDLGDAV